MDSSDDVRLPAVRAASAPVPVDRTAELVRAAASPLMAAPMLAAAMQATASAMTEAMTAMLRPWLVGVPIAPAARDWSGPGVQVSYTHVELRWPAR